MSPAVEYVDIPGRIGRDAARAVSHGAVDRGDYALGDFADSRVIDVGDKKIAGRIHRECVWRGQLSIHGRTAVAPQPRHSGSRYGGDDSIRDHTDAIIRRIGD